MREPDDASTSSATGATSSATGATDSATGATDSASGYSDEALWARVLEGDDTAFAALFDRHHPRVHRHALRFVDSWTDAEDVTAMVFFEAWRKRANVRVVEASVIGWLLVTTVNIARNSDRARRRYEALLLRTRPETVPDHADDVLAAVEGPRVRAGVQQAFERLSPRDQQILALCVIEELSPQAAGELLRVRPGTIRTRLSRAKVRLRTLIEETPGLNDGQNGAIA